MAFEQAFGPLGHVYADDMLAAVHEQLQALTLSMSSEGGAINRQPRPYEIFDRYAEQLEKSSELTAEDRKKATVEQINASLDR